MYASGLKSGSAINKTKLHMSYVSFHLFTMPVNIKIMLLISKYVHPDTYFMRIYPQQTKVLNNLPANGSSMSQQSYKNLDISLKFSKKPHIM